ncbi:MAG: beta strand repeat-containing protein, partial [Alphaproteobacteria bacterium]
MKFFKFFSVVYCFSAPLVVCGADDFSSLNVGENDPNVIFSSSSYAAGVYVGNGGISVYDSINIGYPSVSGFGAIYADETTISPYNFRSSGDISVGNDLNVADGFGVNISGYIDNPIDVTFGGDIINNSGANAIKFDNVGNFAASRIQNSGALISVTTTGNLSLTNVGTALQNMAGAISLFVGGGIDVAGVVENSNSAGALYDDNGNPLYGMVIKSGGDFTVSGGNAGTASVINNGNLYALIGGTTTLAYGFNLSGMENDNIFYFETGKLNLGTENDGAFWANNLNSFVLKLTAGDSVLGAGNIQNGFNNVKYNENANMSLHAATINAQSVRNNAQNLLLSADADININGDVENIKGITRINASNTINANAANIVNNSTMYINGTKGVSLNSVYNNGSLLDVSTDTATGSNLTIAQTITNEAGVTTIAANDITVGGLVTSGGTSASDKLNIIGKGQVEFGGIRVDGGIFTLDALAGNVIAGGETSGGIFVNDGALNLETSLSNLDVSGDVIINGRVTLSGMPATGNGDVNISAYGVTQTNITSGGKIVIDDGIFANANDALRLAMFDSDTIKIGTDTNKADVSVSNGNGLLFGGTTLSVSGDLLVTTGGSIDISSKNTVVDSVTVNNAALVLRGESIVANTDDITVSNGIWFDNLNHNSGVSIVDTNVFSINGNSDIVVSGNGINVGPDKNLSLASKANVDVTGLVDVGGILNVDAANNIVFSNNIFVDSDASIKISGQNINAGNANLSVNGTVDIYGTSGSGSNATSVNFADITSSGNTKINANNVVGNTILVNAGQFVVNGANVTTGLFDAAGGRSELNLSGALNVTDLVVNDNLYQASGAGTNGLWLLGNSTLNAANGAHVMGDVIANSGNGVYNVANRFDIDGNLSVANGAKSSFDVGDLSADSIYNNGVLDLTASNRIDAPLLSNFSDMLINSPVVA